MKLIKSEISNLVLNIFNKKDKVTGALIVNWNQIIGDKFGNKTFPMKITSRKEQENMINTLYIIAETSSISTELLFQKDKIIERITVYLGYKAVHQIKVVVSNLAS